MSENSSGSPTGPRPVSKIIQVYSGKSVNVLSDLRWFSSEQHRPRWRELLVFDQPRGTSRKPVHQFSTCVAVTILNFIFTRRVNFQRLQWQTCVCCFSAKTSASCLVSRACVWSSDNGRSPRCISQFPSLDLQHSLLSQTLNLRTFEKIHPGTGLWLPCRRPLLPNPKTRLKSHSTAWVETSIIE